MNKENHGTILSAPNTVYIDVTNRCNLKCKHCYVSANKNGKEEFCLYELDKLFKQLNAMSVFGVVISGGEPLIRSDIIEIVNLANENNLLVGISTNGILIDNNFIQNTKGKISNIQISLDSSNACNHEKFRGVLNIYNKTLENIKLLCDNGFYVTVATVLTLDNYNEIEDIINISIKLRVKKYRVIKLIETGEAAVNSLNKVSPYDIQRFYDNIKIIEKKYANSIDIELDNEFTNSEYCTAGIKSIYINHNGEVYPCPFLRLKELYCGNVKQTNLKKIWSNSSLLNEIRGMQLPMFCSDCASKNTCDGGCKARIYSKYKKLNSEFPMCMRGSKL